MAARVVLVDRDGVLNRDLGTYVLAPQDLHVFAQATQAVALLNRAGYAVAVVTNQAAVGKQLLSPARLEEIHQALRAELARAGAVLAGVYVCPHRPEDSCDCRKPKAGLITRAQAELGFVAAETWLVGDSPRDVEAAHAAGCRAALVRSGKPHPHNAAAVPVYEDLLAFARALVDARAT